MNRKKKINQELKKRQKRANAKLQHSNKPKYISKAERAKAAEITQDEVDVEQETTTSDE
ncbi:DUF2986 domain-containing protein [Motilimonas sp. KMU-193]|uniref:DUF2986 domain-containing protein n=1 Tax=Motilimonas sp. KMU-193 TaxID=3388668 RepID=UPI00396B0FD4